MNVQGIVLIFPFLRFLSSVARKTETLGYFRQWYELISYPLSLIPPLLHAGLGELNLFGQILGSWQAILTLVSLQSSLAQSLQSL